MSASGSAAAAAGAVSSEPAGQAAGSATPLVLAPPSRQISYTASLAVRARDVAAAAHLAVSLVTAAGGYVASEQQATNGAGGPVSAVSLELKIPAVSYQAVLGQLETRLGREVSFTEQAQDVTQQVADVSSRVASAQAAISQLRALLSRTGSVSDLLAVQDQINAEESDLESLIATQAALARETTYATVSLSVTGLAKTVPHRKRHAAAGGFTGGLRAGWHALAVTVTAVLVALGAALPFLVPLALLLGVGYLVRRRAIHRRRPPAEVS